MTAPHLPTATVPRPRGVIPLDHDVGIQGGHRMRLLSLECWDEWADLRFARVDEGDGVRLTRRVPPPAAWRVEIDGVPARVFDAVGRGDRRFSNGEVRIVPSPATGATLTVTVDLLGDGAALTARFDLPMPT